MLDSLSRGFLGFRGDLLSDLLIVALALIVPALVGAVLAARARRLRLHRVLMWGVLSTVVAYVVVYEASMLAQGGLDFLRGRIRMPEAPYFGVVAGHVAIALVALTVAVLGLTRGRRAAAKSDPAERTALVRVHRRAGYWAFSLLVASVVTGLVVYFLTFVFDAVPTPA